MDFEYSQILANGRCPASEYFLRGRRVNASEVLANTRYLLMVRVRTEDNRNGKSVFEEFDDCDRPTPSGNVAFTDAEYTWFSSID